MREKEGRNIGGRGGTVGTEEEGGAVASPARRGGGGGRVTVGPVGGGRRRRGLAATACAWGGGGWPVDTQGRCTRTEVGEARGVVREERREKRGDESERMMGG